MSQDNQKKTCSGYCYRSLFSGFKEGMLIIELESGDDGQPKDLILVDCNAAFIRMLPDTTEAEQIIGRRASELPNAGKLEELAYWMDVCARVVAGGQPEGGERYSDLLQKQIEFSAVPLNDSRVGLVLYDVTSRKTLEAFYHEMFDAMDDGVFVHDINTAEIVFANRQAGRMYGYSPEEIIGRVMVSQDSPTHNEERVRDLIRQAAEMGELTEELIGVDRNGFQFWIELTLRRATIAGVDRIVAVARDITERKHDLEAIMESERRYRIISEMMSDFTGSLLFHEDGRVEVEWMTDAVTRLTGYTAEEFAASFISPGVSRLIHPDDLATIQAQSRPLYTNQPETIEFRFVTKAGQMKWVRVSHRFESVSEGVLRMIATAKDITEVRQAEDALKRQINHMNALRAIEIAISSSLDLRMTLNTIALQAQNVLNADAVEIMLLDQDAMLLNQVSGRGFRTQIAERSALRLGEGIAGKAALERRIKCAGDISRDSSLVSRELLLAEGFISTCSVPLVARGRLVGVLNTFHRSPTKSTPEYLDLLGMMAMQAAISIDNATTFENLHTRNTQLALDNEVILDAWLRGLDMLARDPKAYAERLPVALELAQILGMGEEEIKQLRRGALLFDLGKSALPEQLLEKPSQLDPDERRQVEEYPRQSVELLTPAEKLKPAMDIPAFHREAWDGSGYPFGLRGDAIPLAARIFAVVDVWYALLSDRPYRSAWTKRQASDYLQQQAGRLFDPAVVDAFLSLMASKEQSAS